jgi:hypothetical protein
MINVKHRKELDRKVDFKLLKAQTEAIGSLEMSVRNHKKPKTADLLLGVWNMLHDILDDLETGKECVLHR